MQGQGWCPAWEHDGEVAAAPGHVTCAAHHHLELRVLKIRDDLARFGAEIRAFEAEPNLHPDEAKEFLETAVRWFFDQELEQLGLRTAPAFRSFGSERQQLDVVVALHVDGPNAWSVDMRVLRHAEHAQLAMHSEIAYRSSPSDAYEKVKKDGSRLIETIQAARDADRELPWTSLVLLGDVWPSRTAKVMRRIHDMTAHRGDVVRVAAGTRPWWPFIDAIVMPGVVYKKHDLFGTEQSAARRADEDRFPCWMSLATDPSDPFRSLAIARAYLVHRIRLLQDPAMPNEGEVFPLDQSAAILGSVRALAGSCEIGRAFLASDAQPPERLWHAGYDRANDRYVSQAYVPPSEPTTCESGHPIEFQLVRRSQ